MWIIAIGQVAVLAWLGVGVFRSLRTGRIVGGLWRPSEISRSEVPLTFWAFIAAYTCGLIFVGRFALESVLEFTRGR